MTTDIPDTSALAHTTQNPHLSVQEYFPFPPFPMGESTRNQHGSSLYAVMGVAPKGRNVLRKEGMNSFDISPFDGLKLSTSNEVCFPREFLKPRLADASRWQLRLASCCSVTRLPCFGQHHLLLAELPASQHTLRRHYPAHLRIFSFCSAQGLFALPNIT